MLLTTVGFVILVFSLVDSKSLKQHAQVWNRQEEIFYELVQGYNVRLRPEAAENEAVVVSTSIYVYSMSSIDELRTDYTMQLLYRQTWVDERLQFNSTAAESKIVGDNWHATKIWTPTIHAVNDKDIGSFIAGDTEGTVLLHIHPNGTVLLSKRVKIKPSCKMQFYRYPMDTQQCTLEIESSTLPVDDLVLVWNENKALNMNRELLINGFSLINYTVDQKTVSYRLTGNYSRITATFDLQREFGHFLLDIYIPSILFVVTSWLSFWIEIQAAPARVTLSMTTMLTLVTSEKAIREKLPKVSYVHALDIWNVVCTGFVFACLVEYALVNYIYHTDKRRKKKSSGMKRAESTATFCSVESDSASAFRIFAKKGESEPGMPSKKAASFASLSDMQSVNQMDMSSCVWPEFKMTPQDIANSIDRKCRFIFPAGFIVFNIIYWLVLWL